jgi:hypothetical protein
MTEEEMDGVPDEDAMDTGEEPSGPRGPLQVPDGEEWSADEDDVEEEAEDEEENSEGEPEEGETAPQGPSRVYLPGDAEEAEKGGDLVCDESAYQLYHTCGTRMCFFI